MTAVGPSVAAEAPLASDNDNPAAPNKGTAHARCFRFEGSFAWGMVTSHTVKSDCVRNAIVRLEMGIRQVGFGLGVSSYFSRLSWRSARISSSGSRILAPLSDHQMLQALQPLSHWP